MQVADGVTGVISFSLFGFTGMMTAADALEWNEALIRMAPLIIICFLIWRLRQQDAAYKRLETKLGDCEKQHAEVNAKFLLLYSQVTHPHSRPMPTPEQFISGKFNLEECVDDSCKVMRNDSK